MNLPPDALTLGVLAGGQARRLGGRDKAWLTCHGEPQLLRLIAAFRGRCGQVLVSANRQLERYREHGLIALPDVHADCGPIAGLEALATACTTPWLLTVPVDAVAVDAGLADALAQRGERGAVAQDAAGLQPLFALYRVADLHAALATAIAGGRYAVRDLQASLQLPTVAFAPQRFGNLNTPEDLRAAGCEEA